MERCPRIHNRNPKLFHARLVWSLAEENPENEKSKYSEQPSDEKCKCERACGDQNRELSCGKLEKMALEDSYFVERKLFPNVDFYSGIILRAMGIPTDLYTVLFAVARTVGWLAQWDEMICDPGQKIGRPRQLYTGPPERQFIPLSAR